jgi:hypothetical protein
MQFLDLFIKKKKDKKIVYSLDLSNDIKSLEYEIFKEEEKYATLPKTIYEKLTHISEKILPVDFDKKTREELKDVIAFAHLNITTRGILSLTILIPLVLIPIVLALWLLSYIDGLGVFFAFILTGTFAYYIYTYPQRLKKIFELRAGSDIVMLILHIVIYMRNFPNLESAVKFASSKLTGPLALDMKKLIWDVHMSNYNSMEEALLSYSQKWRSSFRAFADSINAIVYSLYTSGNKRLELLDESIDVILDSLDEKSNSYASKLKTPVVMVNALGILLPTLVLTMLPILTIFLGEDIPPEAVFGFYNLILPIALFFIIKNILDQRVVTLPEPDISLHPDLPPDNTFRLGKYYISCYIPSILVFLPFIFYWYINSSSFDIWKSFVVTIGVFLSIALFFFLNSFQKIKLRKEVMEMEDEFRQVLFGLGQELDRGVPIEIGLEKIKPTLKGSYALSLVDNIISNIKYKNLTFRGAIFDENQGAILRFPSRLIYSILGAVVEAAEKGTKIVSEIMLSTSRYLNNLHKTQSEIENKFSEIVGSMHMQAKVLLPLITGIMVTLTYVIIKMLDFVGDIFGNLKMTDTGAANFAFFIYFFKGTTISPSVFQLAIGLYTIETIITISWFISGIGVGSDKISMSDTIYKNLIIGCFLYITVLIVSLMIFEPLILIFLSTSTPA